MLGRDMRELGEYTDSIELLSTTHEHYHAILGEDFVDTLRTAKSLAVSLRKMGRVNEAYELTRQTSERYATAYGSRQPDALACQLNLARSVGPRRPGRRPRDRDGCALGLRGIPRRRAPVYLAARNNISTSARHRFGPDRAGAGRPDAGRAAGGARRRSPVHLDLRRQSGELPA